MKNRKLGQKGYAILFAVGLLCVMFGGIWFCKHIVETVFFFQQNIIGVMQQRDETTVQALMESMFAGLSQKTIDKGAEALGQYGYTEYGIFYIAKNMGVIKSAIIALLLFLLLGGFLFYCFHKIMLLQKLEIEVLQQENRRLKEHQLKDEYIATQNKRMQSFIENIAHQMKTPLSRVFTSLDILEASIEDGTAKEHIEESYQHLDSMNELMRRLMDIGRLEAGKVIFQKETLHLNRLLEEVKEGTGLEKTRIRITCEKEDITFFGDEKWMKEAISNILSNALDADKTKGSVEISCMQGTDYIKITIRDHGPGLSNQDIPNIFDRFYLPENVKENHTGIGLNLAKLVIEGHQGSVYVYNHAEGGAVFQIILPVYESLKVRG